MMTIRLYGKRADGRVALVDDDDFDLVSLYRWTLQERTEPPGRYGPYAIGHAQGHTQAMHTLITGYRLTDHRDGNGLNNQRYNLREATYSQNNAGHKRAGCSSQYRGVSWSRKQGMWHAQISAGGRKTLHLGFFHDETTAALAYDNAARDRWGEFARLNFP
jgi:hypothetical protein